MRKLLAALLLLVPAAFVSGAQDQPEEPKLILRSTIEEIPLSEMVQLSAEYSRELYLYIPRYVSGNVSITASRSGTSIENARVQDVLQDCLARFRMTTVRSGNERIVVPIALASNHAPVILESDLDAFRETDWVKVFMPLDHTEPNAVRGAVLPLTTRQGGVVSPVPGGVLICDYCGNVRQLLKVVHELEDTARLITRRYTLPAGADAKAWAPAVSGLLHTDPGSPCVVTPAPAGNGLIITTRESTHAEVARAIKALE